MTVKDKKTGKVYDVSVTRWNESTYERSEDFSTDMLMADPHAEYDSDGAMLAEGIEYVEEYLKGACGPVEGYSELTDEYDITEVPA